MPRYRTAYPPEFRRQMVDLVRSGRRPEELAREFEPTAQSISTWVKQAERDAGKRVDGPTSAEREELARLRRENHRLRQRRSLPGSRRSSIDRLGRRRLRQCNVRQFLRHPRMRADRSASLPISERGADGRLSVHRRLLQSLTPPFGPRLSFAHRIRKEA